MDEFDMEHWKIFDDGIFKSPMAFDASESGLWNGRFVPPPPRPPFMDDNLITDGINSCELCSWAFQDKNAFSLEGSLEAATELGLAFSIGIISVISVLIGAIIIISLLRCKKLKLTKSNSVHHINNTNNGVDLIVAGHSIDPNNEAQLLPWWYRKKNDDSLTNMTNTDTNHPSLRHKTHPPDTLTTTTTTASSTTPHGTNPQVWIWLKNVNTPPTPEPVVFTQPVSIENYYTNTDDSCISTPCKMSEVLYEEISGIG